MGTLGAALATVIGQGLSYIFSLIYLYRHKESFGFDFKLSSFKLDGHILWLLVKLGIPIALQLTAVNISAMYVTGSINSYGVKISAMSGIGDKLRMVVTSITFSFGTAASAMIGQNIGAGNYDRVKEVFLKTFYILLVVCIILSTLCVLFPKSVISLFNSDEELLAMAPKFMLINFVSYMSFSFYTPFNSLVNGLGYASFAFILGIIDGVVARCGLVLLLSKIFDLGIWGVWWGASLASYVGVAIGIYYFFSGRWKKRKAIA